MWTTSWNELMSSRKLLRFNAIDHNRESLLLLCEKHKQNEVDRDLFQALEQLLSDDDEILVSTSGSTGVPRAIQIAKDKLLASARATISALNIQQGAVLAHCLSCEHIGGLMMLVRAMALSAELIRLPITSSPLTQLSQDTRIDLIAMVPMQVIKTIRTASTSTKFTQIKNVLIGGAPLEPQISKQLKDLPNKIFSTFGMTETLSHIALKRIAPGPSDHFECVGPTTISVDEKDRMIINAPHLSERRIHSNDVVELLDNKRFRWLGRYDNVINSGGIKLHPEVLEEKIAERMHGRFFFYQKPDPELGQALVLYVEGEERLIDLSDLLSKYEMPKETVFVDRFKETENGKVDRQKIVSTTLSA